MINLSITQTGKSFSSKDTFSIFNSLNVQFSTIKEAKEYLKITYPKCKRSKMFIDNLHVGYVYRFFNEDISHLPINKWIQRDWIEFQEVKTISPKG
jgi:hypothetical protein